MVKRLNLHISITGKINRYHPDEGSIAENILRINLVYLFNFNVLMLKHTHWSAPRCVCILKNQCFFFPPLNTSGHFSLSDDVRGREVREEDTQSEFCFRAPWCEINSESHTNCWSVFVCCKEQMAATETPWCHTHIIINLTHTHTEQNVKA